jgi:hypothetical protein
MAGAAENSVAWLAADLDGNGFTEIVQPWANGGSLGMIVWQGDAGPVSINNPKQADLAAHNGPRFYVDGAQSQYPGMMNGGVTAPMYYFVREYPSHTEIHYVTLYARQGGQTCHALRAGTEFDCIVQTMGEQQADLERVTVFIVQDAAGNWNVSQMNYYAHGDASTYDTAQIPFSGTNPIVHASLNGHASWNTMAVGTRVVRYTAPFVIAIVDVMDDDGVQWVPSDLIEIGLTPKGDPINQQVWAQYGGRLGNHSPNFVNGGTYFNGSNLAPADWVWLEFASLRGRLSGPLYGEMFDGNGPQGPGTWPEIRGAG